MAFKMKSPLKKDNPGQIKEWVDTAWLSQIFNKERAKKELEDRGYDWATLGSNKEHPTRIYLKKTDTKSIKGFVRPERIEG